MATGLTKWGLVSQLLTSLSVAGSANVALTGAQAQSGNITLTGAITANIAVAVPTNLTGSAIEAGMVWRVYNSTTGNYALTFIGPSGTGVVVPQGKAMLLMWDGTNMVPFLTDAGNVGAARLLYVNSADGTAIANTTAETNFSLNLALAPNFLVAGRVLRVTISGKYSDTGTPTLQLKLKMGSVLLLDLGAVALGSGVSNKQFTATFICVVLTTGVTGTVRTHLENALLDDDQRQAIANTATIDTTIAETIQPSAQWSAADAANTLTPELLLIEALN